MCLAREESRPHHIYQSLDDSITLGLGNWNDGEKVSRCFFSPGLIGIHSSPFEGWRRFEWLAHCAYSSAVQQFSPEMSSSGRWQWPLLFTFVSSFWCRAFSPVPGSSTDGDFWNLRRIQPCYQSPYLLQPTGCPKQSDEINLYFGKATLSESY